MTTPSWPLTLPQRFLRRGYAEGFKDNIIRSENEIGPAKTRRRATAAIRPVSGIMMMTATELATFQDFVEDDLGDGALAFTMPAQSADSGTWLVRMTAPFEISPNDFHWEVSMSLEVLP